MTPGGNKATPGGGIKSTPGGGATAGGPGMGQGEAELPATKARKLYQKAKDQYKLITEQGQGAGNLMQTLMDVTEALRIMNSIENPSKAIKKDKNGMMALKMQIDEDFSGVKENFGKKSKEAEAKA